MNTLICDDIRDEGLELAIMASDAVAKCQYFNKASGALSYIKTGARVDVCFLDIVMPGMTGIELARQIRKIERAEQSDPREIVFISASNEYAAESFEVNAFSYLLKPTAPQKVTNILQQIIGIKNAKDVAGIPLITKNMTRFLYFREISFIEVRNNKVHFYLIDGNELVITSTLGALLPKIMEDRRFGRCHRSFVVNMNDTRTIQDNIVVMRSGKQIPITRTYADFRNEYIEYLR